MYEAVLPLVRPALVCAVVKPPDRPWGRAEKMGTGITSPTISVSPEFWSFASSGFSG